MKSICKECDIEPEKIVDEAIDRTNWRRTVSERVGRAEERRTEQREWKRELKKRHAGADPVGVTDWECDECGRYFREKVGLIGHKKRKSSCAAVH